MKSKPMGRTPPPPGSSFAERHNQTTLIGSQTHVSLDHWLVVLLQIQLVSYLDFHDPIFFNLFHYTSFLLVSLQKYYNPQDRFLSLQKSTSEEKREMTTQAGSQLLRRPLQFTSARSLGSSRKSSFVVKAASTPVSTQGW